MDPRDGRGLDRREFVKSAVAIGGASALSACLDMFEGKQAPDREVPRGDDPAALPDRQHAWNEFLPSDDHGNDVNARHHVLLYLDLSIDGVDGPPAASERETVESAFRSLERAYEFSNDGLLFTVGYSRSYFDRFEESLPDSVGLPAPEALSSLEDPAFDEQDAVVHLASDYGDVVLEAEQALLGERDSANGREMDADLAGVFERADRRTGFIGKGLPAENATDDLEGIPKDADVDEDSPLFMGFKSGFEKNQASEDRVTIQSGPFAGGTTQHVSKIRLRLDDWYGEQDHDDRVAEMFCPAHADDGLVEGTGENLGNSSKMTETGCPAHIDEDAQEYGRIGHSQKTARARDDDDSPLILRRDFDSTDGGEAGLHFLAVQRSIDDFVETREAMNGTDATENPAIRQRVNNGILEYTFVKRRGNFLLPPRPKRALPTPQGE